MRAITVIGRVAPTFSFLNCPFIAIAMCYISLYGPGFFTARAVFVFRWCSYTSDQRLAGKRGGVRIVDSQAEEPLDEARRPSVLSILDGKIFHVPPAMRVVQ